MKLRRHHKIYYLGGIVILLATGSFVVRNAVSSAHAGAVSRINSTVVVNAASGATFGPAPDGASPALTAEQAWTDYVDEAGGSESIPGNVTIQLGLVDWPSGPADAPSAGNETISSGIAYIALNELAYGYSEPSTCPPSSYLQAPGESSTAQPSSNSCVDWLLVDANTGQQIMETWQNTG
jgi:hypothetical protein